MKKIFFNSMPFLFAVLSCSYFAQKIKSDEITYYYNRLPVLSLDKTIKNYQVTIDPVYEAKNKELLKQYEIKKNNAEVKYQKEMAEYEALVRAAKANNHAKMAGNGNSVATVTMVSNRYVKQIPYKPYMTVVPQPELQTTYDTQQLASTYINLKGYKNNAANALKVVITLYGYEHSQPQLITEQHTAMKIGSGGSFTYESIHYHTEFSYRYPIGVEVFTPDGKKVLSINPIELSQYKLYTSSSTIDPDMIDNELLIKSTEDRILQANLRYINNLLKYGFAKVKRVASLYYIKNDDKKYADLTDAYNEASSGLRMLQQDNNGAKAKLDKASALWTAALNTANTNNATSPINQETETAIYFNLLEVNFAEGNVGKAQTILNKLNTYGLSPAETKTKNDFDLLMAERSAYQQKMQ
jgi:hypothetical protein